MSQLWWTVNIAKLRPGCRSNIIMSIIIGSCSSNSNQEVFHCHWCKCIRPVSCWFCWLTVDYGTLFLCWGVSVIDVSFDAFDTKYYQVSSIMIHLFAYISISITDTFEVYQYQWYVKLDQLSRQTDHATTDVAIGRIYSVSQNIEVFLKIFS